MLLIFKRLLLIIVLGLQWPTLCFAELDNDTEVLVSEPIENARIYRNPEERREAGLGTQLTKWLKFSGLIETETEFFNQHFVHRSDTSKVETPNFAIQLGFDVKFSEWLSAEIIIEAEHDGQRFFVDLDEGFINAEIEQWGFKVGRQYVTFGEYYSHFITGPMLEFGETRGTALIIDYSPLEIFELSAFIFESEVGHHRGNPDIDWGVSIDYASEDESIRFGLGYLSDLSESDEQFISGVTYLNRVSAWNAYVLLGFTNVEFTAEVVKALNAFDEYDRQSDKPFAVNFELAYFPVSTTQFALRLEYSDEFEDQPKWQYGIASTWRPTDRISISLEYLYSHFKNNFAYDDDDHELTERHLVALQMALEF